MPYSITTKDGITLQGIPDDVPADAPELKQRVQTIRAQMAAGQNPQAPNINPSKLKGSVAGGAFMGMRDPIDGGSQLAVRGAQALGMASPQDVAGVDNIVRTANAEYDASRPMAGRDGFDLARVAGGVVNPVNRAVPMGGAQSSSGVALRSGLQGGLSGLLQPVTNTDDFWGEKAKQVGAGSLFGAVGGYAIDKMAGGVGNMLAAVRARPGFPEFLGGPSAGVPAAVQSQTILAQSAAKQGIDLAAIPKAILDDVKGSVEQALKAGKNIDAAALIRQAEGRAVLGDDAALMLGQSTRDPQSFTREMDLRGINGAGKPVADRLTLQNQRFIDKVSGMGAKGAPDAYDAGAQSIASLQALDKQLSAGVTAAYNKFRASGGATIDVPLQPMAQKLGDVLDTYGKENIPAAVLSKLNEYGLMGGKQTKVFDLLEADKLIKIINANLDPLKGPQAGALGALRKGLSESIDLADTQSAGATGPAADLLKEALKKAKSRFSLHEAVPALESAAKDKGAQEAFIRQFITSKSAGVDTVAELTKMLPPEALDSVRRSVLADILESAAPGARRGSDSSLFSQAGFNRAIEDIGDRKLLMLFGEDGLKQLRQIGRVAEWAQKAPKASAVNNSNTAAASMNLLQALTNGGNPIANRLLSMPGVNLAKNSLQQAADESAAGAALGAKVRPQTPKMTPEEINALRALLPQTGGALGLSASSAFGQ